MSDAYRTIHLERMGAVAILTLSRPERMNAIDKQMLGELQDALDDVERDDELRALVVKGAGENFSSGFDLKEQMEARPSGLTAWREILDRDFSTVTRFWHLKKPTIAAVRGYCLAGACELALICDITIAADDAIFGEPELKFGAGIVVMILPWLVGPKRAKEIILTGADRISAVEAARIGLINRVVPGDQLDSTAIALARHIAVIDPNLVQKTKQAINQCFETMGFDLLALGFRNQTFCPFARQRRAPIQRDPHPPPVGHFLFSEKAPATTGARTIGAAELGGRWQQHPARTSAFTALVVALRPGFARRQAALKDQEKMALVNHTSSESRLPLTRSLSDSETKLFVRSRASAARQSSATRTRRQSAISFLAKRRRRPLAPGRSAPPS